MIAFLDANALIYLVVGAEPFAESVRVQLRGLHSEHDAVRIAMSVLSRLKCRIGPLRAGDARTLAEYDAFFASPDLILVALSIAVIDLASELRARYNLKTPDALQVACCLQLGTDHVFLTDDKNFCRVAGLRTRVLG